MTIDLIHERLRHHQPQTIDEPTFARAAVAIVLQEGEEGAEFIVIHRAHRPGDPWSGHMALPGGRQQAADADLYATAVRETWEEVGVNLDSGGEMLGHLDDLRAVGQGKLLNLMIRPFVCAVRSAVTLAPNHNEVQSAFWLSLASLRKPETRGTYRHHTGSAMEHPAFLYRGYTIWGLTHRILTTFLDVVG